MRSILGPGTGGSRVDRDESADAGTKDTARARAAQFHGRPCYAPPGLWPHMGVAGASSNTRAHARSQGWAPFRERGAIMANAENAVPARPAAAWQAVWGVLLNRDRPSSRYDPGVRRWRPR